MGFVRVWCHSRGNGRFWLRCDSEDLLDIMHLTQDVTLAAMRFFTNR